MRNIILIAAAASFLVAISSVLALNNMVVHHPINNLLGWPPFTCLIDYSTVPVALKWGDIPTCPQVKECPFGKNAAVPVCNSVGQLAVTGQAVWQEITIPEDIKIVSSSDEFVINEEICPEEKPIMSIGNRTGEWWNRGGAYDSPPIQWINDVTEFAKALYKYNINRTELELVIPPNESSFVDEFGIVVYPPPPISSSFFIQHTDYLAMVCSLKEKGSTPSLAVETISGNEVNIEADVLCFRYFYGKPFSYSKIGTVVAKLQMPSVVIGNWNKGTIDVTKVVYEYYNTTDDLFRVGTIKFQKKLKVVEPTAVKLEVQSFAGPSEGNERLARFVIRNAGDGKATIDGIFVRGKDMKLICDRNDLEPGQSAECIAILDRNDRNLRLKFSEWPCGKPKHNALALSLKTSDGEEEGNFCESSSDCSIGEECCVNLCRPAAEGVCDDIDSDGILDTWVPTKDG